MTRWELIQAFRQIARLLFLEDVKEKETLARIKVLVLNVLTETDTDAPLKFEAEK
jgi:hypothetical protein